MNKKILGLSFNKFKVLLFKQTGQPWNCLEINTKCVSLDWNEPLIELSKEYGKHIDSLPGFSPKWELLGHLGTTNNWGEFKNITAGVYCSYNYLSRFKSKQRFLVREFKINQLPKFINPKLEYLIPLCYNKVPFQLLDK